MSASSSSSSSVTIPTGAPNMDDMNPGKALELLVSSIYVGQSRGAWRMEEVPVLLKAIQVIQDTFGKPPAEASKGPSK